MKVFALLIIMVLGGVNIGFSQQKKKKSDTLEIQMPDKDYNTSSTTEFIDSDDNKDSIVKVAEEMPVFPGGQKAMKEWIDKNLVYPQESLEDEIQGKVFVSVTIEIDGSISSPEVRRGIGSACDKEAIRLVKLMPKWIPGKSNGKAIKMKEFVIIEFSI